MTLADDLACVGCRYNLRGLHPDGRCPECGFLISVSLHARYAAADVFRPDLSRIARRCRRRWAWGLACVFAGSAATAVVAALPFAWLEPHTRPWPVLLSIAVIGWVVTLAGVWLTATWDAALFVPGKRSLTWLWAIGCLIVVCLPAAVGLDRMDRHKQWGPLVGVCGLTAPVLAAEFQWRLARLATALNRPWARIQFSLLAGVLLLRGLVSVAMVGMGEWGSSLTILFVATNPACVSAATAVLIVREAVERTGWEWPLLFAAVPVWSLTLVAVLWRALLRPAGGRQSTGANSRP